MLISAPVYFSATTLLGGSINFSFKVPGTYAGLTPTDQTAARYLKEIRIWSDSPQNGDVLTNLKITDTDGVCFAPEQAALPNYPDVALFSELASLPAGLSTGILLNPDGCTIVNPSTDLKPVPSGLYLSGTFSSGGLSLGKTMRCQIMWFRYVAF